MSTASTSTPSASRRCATALPMPPAAPVTTARRLPFREPIDLTNAPDIAGATHRTKPSLPALCGFPIDEATKPGSRQTPTERRPTGTILKRSHRVQANCCAAFRGLRRPAPTRSAGRPTASLRRHQPTGKQRSACNAQRSPRTGRRQIGVKPLCGAENDADQAAALLQSAIRSMQTRLAIATMQPRRSACWRGAGEASRKRFPGGFCEKPIGLENRAKHR